MVLTRFHVVGLFVVCILFGLSTAGVFADDTLVLNNTDSVYALGGYLGLLEDPDDNLTIAGALIRKDEFRISSENEPNIGFTSSVYWVKLTIRNGSSSGSWIVEHGYPPMDLIELYRVTDGAVVSRETSGDNIPQDRRSLPGRTARFAVGAEAGTEIELYFRFKTESSMVFPMKVWHVEAFAERELHTRFVLGLYFGFMLVMVLYNIVIYLATKERSYLYYVLFVASNAVFQACILGVAQLYLWSGSVWWTDHALVFFASLAVAFSAMFTRRFLQTKKWLPRLYIAIEVSLIVSLVNSAASLFIPYSISILVTNTMLVVFSIVYVAVAILVWIRGYKPARFYLLAWAMLLLAVFILALKNYGLAPSNWFTSYVLQIGSVFEILLLSLAIADRISVLRQMHLETERQLRVSQATELRVTTEKLYFDNLTGLPNRNRLLSDSEKLENPHLFLINVDHFRQINDHYGNKIGDQVLLELKKRIDRFEHDSPPTLYKLHADEFALVIDDKLSESDCFRLGSRLKDLSESDPYDIDGQDIRLDVSIGISSGGGYLLEQADMALSEARSRHTFVTVFDPAMETKKRYESNLRVVGVIKDALNRNTIVPYYQPIVNNDTGKIEKYECLIRIRDSKDEIISPRTFLPVAKASKLYPELSRRMIVKCFEKFRRSDLTFSLNLSIEDILQKDTIELIRSCVDSFDGTDRVIFEITESEGIHRYDLASRFIEEMKSTGCGIAIDDFGSGFSNFEHILRLKIDYLKLDSSLIKNLDHDEQARAIVDTIVRFASRLGIRTIAEFVHSDEVLQAVKALGIDYSQGNHLGPAAANLLER